MNHPGIILLKDKIIPMQTILNRKTSQKMVLVLGVSMMLSCSSSQKNASQNNFQSPLSDDEKFYPSFISSTEIGLSQMPSNESMDSVYSGDIKQSLYFEILGHNGRPVKKVTLNDAKLIRDFVSGYAYNWVSNYDSVELITQSNGNLVRTLGLNEQLNAKQILALQNADLNSEVILNVTYKSKNSITKLIETSYVNVVLTVIPEKEAEYQGGYEMLSKYIETNAIQIIQNTLEEELQKGSVSFKIDEQGKVVDEIIIQSTGDINMDKLVLKVIKDMEQWKPAENVKGEKVKQNFIFSFGNGGC